MSGTDIWLDNIAAELRELLDRVGELDGEDAWMLLVLLARVAQHPAPPRELGGLLAKSISCGIIQSCLERATQPTPVSLLDALDTALLSGEEPSGLLADALFDLDDMVSVLDLEDRREEARRIAAQAVALIDLAPGHAAALDRWGERRLSTMNDSSSAAPVWSAVVSAAATAVVNALPRTTHPLFDVTSLLDRAGRPSPAAGRVINLFKSAPSTQRAWSLAASDSGAPWAPVEGGNWTSYLDGADTVVQVHVAAGAEPPRSARLEVSAGPNTWTHTVPAERRSGSCAWFRLGSERAQARLFQRARAEMGLKHGDPVAISLRWDPDGQQ